MSTVWIDPVELKASAGTLARSAVLIQETMTGTRTTCQCEVPRSLLAWLDEELMAITIASLQAAVGYLEQAVDIAQRGLQIEADQSLVAATPAMGTVTSTASLNDALLAGGSIVGGFSLTEGIELVPSYGSGPLVGGFSLTAGIQPVSSSSLNDHLVGSGSTVGGPTTAAFLAQNPLLAAAENLRNRSGASAPGLGGFNGLSQSNDDIIRNVLAPDGLDHVGGGIYEDESGRQGTLSQTYRDRRDGDLRF